MVRQTKIYEKKWELKFGIIFLKMRYGDITRADRRAAFTTSNWDWIIHFRTQIFRIRLAYELTFLLKCTCVAERTGWSI